MRGCQRFGRVITRPGGCVRTWAIALSSIGLVVFFFWAAGMLLRKALPKDWLPEACHRSEEGFECVVLMSLTALLIFLFIILMLIFFCCFFSMCCYDPCARDWDAESEQSNI